MPFDPMAGEPGPAQARRVLLACLAIYVLTAAWGLLAGYPWDDDCITRYHNARQALTDPRQFISIWNRPLSIVLLVLPTQLGMKAMVLFGVPPEEYMPYNITDYDIEPSAFCYAFGQNYQAINYFRIDMPGMTRANLLMRIKLLLSVNIPSMFGFTV